MANKKSQSATVVKGLRLPVDMLKKVEELAVKQNRTTSNMLRVLIREALNGK